LESIVFVFFVEKKDKAKGEAQFHLSRGLTFQSFLACLESWGYSIARFWGHGMVDFVASSYSVLHG